jgi:hypothetical protein
MDVAPHYQHEQGAEDVGDKGMAELCELALEGDADAAARALSFAADLDADLEA